MKRKVIIVIIAILIILGLIKCTNDIYGKNKLESKVESQVILENKEDKKDENKDTKPELTYSDNLRIYYSLGQKTTEDSQYEMVEKFISDKKVIEIFIEGYTDRSGSVKFNKKMAQKRIDDIIQKLVSLGIEKEKITSDAIGETTKFGTSPNKNRVLNVFVKYYQK